MKVTLPNRKNKTIPGADRHWHYNSETGWYELTAIPAATGRGFVAAGLVAHAGAMVHPGMPPILYALAGLALSLGCRSEHGILILACLNGLLVPVASELHLGHAGLFAAVDAEFLPTGLSFVTLAVVQQIARLIYARWNRNLKVPELLTRKHAGIPKTAIHS